MRQALIIDAFAATPDTAAVLRQIQQDRQLGKSRLTLMEGGVAAAVAHYAHTGTPQVVIVEDEGQDQNSLLERLDQLAEVCESGTRVIVIGSVNDIGLYRSLTGRGISEYLLRPLTSRQMLDSLNGLFADPHAAPRGRIIACWGARGGVGASTLAQNLAWGLGQHLREAVVYIDLDLAFGTSVLAFNIDAKQTVADALAHPERLDEVLMERCMVDYDDHLQVLASPGDCRVHGGVTLDGIDRMIDLAGRMAGLVVLDIPHVWAEWSEHLLGVADEVVVVATPDFAALRDAKSMLETIAVRRSGAPAPRLVLNRMDAKHPLLTAKDFEEALKIKPALTIPADPAVFGQAASNGQMLGETARTHKVTQQFQQLAALLAGRTPPARKSMSTLGKGLLLDWLKR